MNKTDFINWKTHPVTEKVFFQLKERILEIQEILGERAGSNPIQDAKYTGAIAAYNDLLNIDMAEDIKE